MSTNRKTSLDHDYLPIIWLENNRKPVKNVFNFILSIPTMLSVIKKKKKKHLYRLEHTILIIIPIFPVQKGYIFFNHTIDCIDNYLV